ncbi:MAG: tRNA1(Val) (adenine(37)-N6)-methyltransferase [Persicimonas sp.]
MATRDRDITVDKLGEDRPLEIAQHCDGYRFGLDALLLATDLPPIEPGATVVELGAAQGVVSLCIARRHPTARVVALERQESLYDLLVDNIARNDLQSRVEPLRGDVRDFRDILSPHSAQLVVCNPPYFRRGSRRPSNNAERAAARHEMHGGLTDFVDAARYTLEQRGWFKLISPPLRLGDMMSARVETDLSLASLRFFHSRKTSDAYLFEALLRRGGAPDIQVCPPLYIYRNDKDYTGEVQRRIDEAPRAPDGADS